MDCAKKRKKTLAFFCFVIKMVFMKKFLCCALFFLWGALSADEPLLEAVKLGRVDAYQSGADNSPVAGAFFRERPNTYLYVWGLNSANANGVMEKEGNRVPSDKEIRQTIAWFTSKKLPFVWWSSAKVLENYGFRFGGVQTGIALDIGEKLPPAPSKSEELQIKVVETESELSSFVEVSATVFAINGQLAKKQWLAMNTSLMKKGKQIHFIALLEGKVVGTASLNLASNSAGIWNVATLPGYRKQGIGSSLVYEALLEAKKQHHTSVMALLAPENMAKHLFLKMGFQPLREFPFYIFNSN